jgi:hypothetical protein
VPFQGREGGYGSSHCRRKSQTRPARSRVGIRAAPSPPERGPGPRQESKHETP